MWHLYKGILRPLYIPLKGRASLITIFAILKLYQSSFISLHKPPDDRTLE